jgi:hypothetical protein
MKLVTGDARELGPNRDSFFSTDSPQKRLDLGLTFKEPML